MRRAAHRYGRAVHRRPPGTGRVRLAGRSTAGTDPDGAVGRRGGGHRRTRRGARRREASRLGAERLCACRARTAGRLSDDDAVAFRHPLIRSAVYGRAPRRTGSPRIARWPTRCRRVRRPPRLAPRRRRDRLRRRRGRRDGGRGPPRGSARRLRGECGRTRAGRPADRGPGGARPAAARPRRWVPATQLNWTGRRRWRRKRRR